MTTVKQHGALLAKGRLVRLSCGIEGTEDLIADIDQALAAI